MSFTDDAVREWIENLPAHAAMPGDHGPNMKPCKWYKVVRGRYTSTETDTLILFETQLDKRYGFKLIEGGGIDWPHGTTVRPLAKAVKQALQKASRDLAAATAAHRAFEDGTRLFLAQKTKGVEPT